MIDLQPWTGILSEVLDQPYLELMVVRFHHKAQIHVNPVTWARAVLLTSLNKLDP